MISDWLSTELKVLQGGQDVGLLELLFVSQMLDNDNMNETEVEYKQRHCMSTHRDVHEDERRRDLAPLRHSAA